MADFKGMASALQKAMKTIGRNNGTKVPESQDPLDAVLHEYYVSKMGEKVFGDRAKEAKDEMLKSITEDTKDRINAILASTKKNNAGEGAIVGGGQFYVLDFSTRRGSVRLDPAALKVRLAVDYNIKMEDIEKLFEECSVQDEPTKIYSVKPVHD
jgi:hypothetical protein